MSFMIEFPESHQGNGLPLWAEYLD